MIRQALAFAGSLLVFTTASSALPQQQDAADTILAKLIVGLGSSDRKLREQSAAALRARGIATEAALHAAARGDRPSALQARSVLAEIASGITPALEPEFAEFVRHYADAEDLQKATVPYKIADSGTAGLRAVLGLYRRTHDAELLGPLSEHRHESAVLMLGLGMDADAAKMTGNPSADDLPSAHGTLGDATAFLLLDGRLASARSELQRQPLTEANAGVTYLLDRAAGDLPAALADARRVPRWPRLTDEILARQHDWPSMIKRLEADADELSSGEQFGFLCRYDQLVGNADDARRAARRLVTDTDVDFQKGGIHPLNAAHELFMCGFPDQAIDVLVGHHELAQASWYLPARLRFDESLSIVDIAKGKFPAEFGTARSNSAKSLHFIGRLQEARRIIQETEDVGAAHECGLTSLEEKLATQILARPEYRDSDASQSVFFTMGIDDWASASIWYRFLLRHHGPKEISQAVRDVRHTFERSMDPAVLRRLGQAVLEETTNGGSERQSDQLAAIGGLLASRNCPDVAAGFFARVERAADSADALRRAGDFQADRDNWDAAQDDYAMAFELDPLQAAPLYLRGWALCHLGRGDEGRRLMDRGDVLPLCDAEQRKKLLDAMIRHDLLPEARREVQQFVNLNGSGSFESGEALRWAAGDARQRKDFSAAVTLLLDWSLRMQQGGAGFLQPLAAMEVPAMIHQADAEAMVSAGRIGAAMNDAKAALALVPLDPDLPVDLVKLFADSGYKVEADELYREQAALYRGLIDRYHESGSARHLLASMQLRCRRDLADAQEFAAAAAALEPDNPAFLETLSQVDFARGDLKGATDQMRRCVEIDPESNRYRQQLAVYEADRRTHR